MKYLIVDEKRLKRGQPFKKLIGSILNIEQYKEGIAILEYIIDVCRSYDTAIHNTYIYFNVQAETKYSKLNRYLEGVEKNVQYGNKPYFDVDYAIGLLKEK